MNIQNTLYITDLDGTLLNDDQFLPEKSASFLSHAVQNGLNFTYATASPNISS